MSPHALLVIGGRAQTVRKAKDLGLRVLSVQHPAQFVPGAGEVADSLIVTDFTRWDTVRPIVVDAYRRYRFVRAVSLTGAGSELASRLNDLLGLGGTPAECNRLLLDRWAMRRHLATHPTGTVGGLVPVVAELFDDEVGLTDFGKRYGYPLVVKPTSGAVGAGAVRVDGSEQVPDVIRWVNEHRRVRHRSAALPGVPQFMVEEYVAGPQYTVETFSFHGRHVVVAVAEKLSGRGIEPIGWAVPARLSRSQEAALSDGAVAVLDAVGVVDGIGRTEFTLSTAGPRLIGSHHRIGGDRIVDLLEVAYGIDLETYTVAWPVGLVEPLNPWPVAKQAAAIRFLTAAPGTVTDVSGVEDVRAQSGVVQVELTVGRGSLVRRLAGGRARVGQILAFGADTAEAVRRCEEHAAAVTIETR